MVRSQIPAHTATVQQIRASSSGREGVKYYLLEGKMKESNKIPTYSRMSGRLTAQFAVSASLSWLADFKMQNFETNMPLFIVHTEHEHTQWPD